MTARLTLPGAAALGLCVTAALALSACGNGKAAPEPVRPVLTQVVAPGAVATRDVYAGEVRARHEAELAFRIAGKIVARPVDAGARVARGQVLARLDPEDAKLSAHAARARLASAESDFALARSERERHADLLAKKFISQSAFDARDNALANSRALVEQMRAQATLSANQAEYTTLTADADGVVISVSAEPGQVVSAGQPVLKLARSAEKEIVVNAPENQLARFRPGDAVAVSLWADSRVAFAGRVREIAGGADPVTRTFAIRISTPGAPSSVQLGMTANVAFPAQTDAGLVVLPLGALGRADADPAVWIFDPRSGQVTLRSVRVGQYREDGVTITGGLSPGERVVIAGAHKLRPGQVVRLASDPAGNAPGPAR